MLFTVRCNLLALQRKARVRVYTETKRKHIIYWGSMKYICSLTRVKMCNYGPLLNRKKSYYFI